MGVIARVSVTPVSLAGRLRSGTMGKVSRIACVLRWMGWMTRAVLIDATTLITTAPKTVPATPSDDAASAAAAVASAPARIWGTLTSKRRSWPRSSSGGSEEPVS
ncbi:MAG: hypothetical protein H0V02_03965 [Nocardioidaceae bacterium]|nr:hypothetical protein [Nocardioidaceae bacterium]